MKIYQTKSIKLHGTEFKEVHKKAIAFYQKIAKKTKRRPYVRSFYFKKDKIFLSVFWQHIWDKKKWQDRMRRLQYLPAAIDLICNTSCAPVSKTNPNKKNEILHRFAGITKNKDMFFVQIKEDKRSGQKYLVSVFPSN